MRISVALCTYNGARYLPEQLRSIAAQTLVPDEIVVCDDGSTDETRQIVERFAWESGIEVRWSGNEQRLGSSRNFMRAIGLCRGELVALADQDDVWLPAKLARASTYFAGAPHVEAVFSDGVLVDGEGRPLGRTGWDEIRFDESERRAIRDGCALRLLARRNVVTGATLILRRRGDPLPLLADGWVHDHWIAAVMAARGALGMIEEPLIWYRVHAGQQIGTRAVAPSSLRAWWRSEAARLRGLVPVLAQMQREGTLHQPTDLVYVAERARHYELRERMPGPRLRRVPRVAREALAGGYHRHSDGWRSVLRDLVLTSE
jgi:glycosyltransferase involved in cell wall biosynthesis